MKIHIFMAKIEIKLKAHGKLGSLRIISERESLVSDISYLASAVIRSKSNISSAQTKLESLFIRFAASARMGSGRNILIIDEFNVYVNNKCFCFQS